MRARRIPAIPLIAGTIALCLTAACSGAGFPGSTGSSSAEPSATQPSATSAAETITPENAGKPLTAEVKPAAPFTVSVPGVVTIQGTPGSVHGAGSIRVQPVSGSTSANADFEIAGRGVDVQVVGTSLSRDLTVTFTGVDVSDDPSVLYAVAHQADDGTIDLRDAERVGVDGLRFTTRGFSRNWPIRINVKKWVRDRFGALADVVAGRTNPDRCKNDAPEWSLLTSTTNLVHACSLTNRDDDGAVRAEAQFKTNRRSWIYALVPSGASYVWVKDQPKAVQRIVSFYGDESEGRYVLLGGRDGKFTAGYPRPTGGTVDKTFRFGTDGLTEMLSLAEALLKVVLLGHSEVAGKTLTAAAGVLLTKCQGDVWGVPRGGPNEALELFSCIVEEVGGGLADPGRAFRSAMNLYGDHAYAQAAAQGLRNSANGLFLLGKALFLAELLPVLRNEMNRVVDSTLALLAPMSTKAQLRLIGAPASPTPPPPVATTPAPAPTTSGPVSASPTRSRTLVPSPDPTDPVPVTDPPTSAPVRGPRG